MAGVRAQPPQGGNGVMTKPLMALPPVGKTNPRYGYGPSAQGVDGIEDGGCFQSRCAKGCTSTHYPGPMAPRRHPPGLRASLLRAPNKCQLLPLEIAPKGMSSCNSSGDQALFLEGSCQLAERQRQSSTIGHQVCQAGWLSGRNGEMLLLLVQSGCEGWRP